MTVEENKAPKILKKKPVSDDSTTDPGIGIDSVKMESNKKVKKEKKKRKKDPETEEASANDPINEDEIASSDSQLKKRRKKRVPAESSEQVVDVPGVPDDIKVPFPVTTTPNPKKKRDPPVPTDRDPLQEQRTVFVGNLPLEIKRNQFRALFRKYGTIQSVRLRSAPRLDARKPARMSVIKRRFQEERSSLNGYVRFNEEASAQKAAAEADGICFQDHHLRVNMACSQRRSDPSCSVFVGGLSVHAEDEQLWQLFQTCGDITSVRLIRDATTSVGKGFGYVNFKSEEAVRNALKLNESELDGQTIRVQKCRVTSRKKVDAATGQKLRKAVDDKDKGEKSSKWIAPVNKFSGDAVAESKAKIKKLKNKNKERWDEFKKKQRSLAQSLTKTITPATVSVPKPVVTTPQSGTDGATQQNKKITFNFDDTNDAARDKKKKGAEKLKDLKAKKEAKKKKKSKSLEAHHRKSISEPLSNLLPK